MLVKTIAANEVAEINYPVAIFDNDLPQYWFFQDSGTEPWCTMCGA